MLITKAITRRKFNALAGTGAGMAMLLPGVARAREAVARESESHQKGESMRNRTGNNTVIKKFLPPRMAKDIETNVVYRKEDEFASHSYNRGFWETASGHIITNFSLTKVNYKGDPDNLSHNNLARNPGGRRLMSLRSEDRGKTWKVSPFPADTSRKRSTDDGMDSMAEICPIDYLNKDTLVANYSGGYYSLSRTDVRISKDGGLTWSSSYRLPLDGLQSLGGIYSSLVRPDGHCLLFLFEISKDGWNRHPLVYRSTDDGSTFHFMSFITVKNDPFAAGVTIREGVNLAYGGHRWFYPRGYMLPSGRILCSLRCQRDPRGAMWTELYRSDDGGQTWQFHSRVNDFGAPGSLVQMNDGRLVMVYGYRLPPYGIRAVVSEDGGFTWGQELIIRDDGGSWDLGYPNAWLAEPGKIGVVYYFNSKNDPIQVKPGGTLAGAGGVRHIARSFFSID